MSLISFVISSPLGFWWAFVILKESHATQQPPDKSIFSWEEEKVQKHQPKKLGQHCKQTYPRCSHLFTGHIIAKRLRKGTKIRSGPWCGLWDGGQGGRRKEGVQIVLFRRGLRYRSLLELAFISEEVSYEESKEGWKIPNYGQSDLGRKEAQWWLLVLGTELSYGKPCSLRANTEVIDSAQLAGVHDQCPILVTKSFDSRGRQLSAQVKLTAPYSTPTSLAYVVY